MTKSSNNINKLKPNNNYLKKKFIKFAYLQVVHRWTLITR